MNGTVQGSVAAAVESVAQVLPLLAGSGQVPARKTSLAAVGVLNPHRHEGYPSIRLPGPRLGQVSDSGVRLVRTPPAVTMTPRCEDVESIVHAFVVTHARIAKGIQTAQDVEPPPCRMVQPGELGMDRLPGVFAAEQTVTQQELHGLGSRSSHLVHPVPVARALVLCDAFDHRQRRVDRRVAST